ncbi:MAG: hypothetical protein WC544_03495 [Patescibacteria group bacterium]
MNIASFVQKFTIFIKKIVTHFAPHLDELLSAIIARMYGKELLPGIETAPIEMRKGNCTIRMDPNEYLRLYGHLMIGCGEGDLDEHGDGEEDVCAADLVARQLGVADHPRLIPLLNFVRREESDGHTTALDLASCVKVMNFFAKRKSPRYMEVWVATVVLPYLTNDAEFPVRETKHRRLAQLYDRWLAENKLDPSDPTLYHLGHLVQVLAKQPPSKLFDAAELTALLCASGPDGQETAYRWLVPMFDAFRAKQMDFLQCVEILKGLKPQVIKPFPNSHQREWWQVMTVPRSLNPGDLRSLNSAARFLFNNLDFLIVQRPNGATSILQQKSFNGEMLRMVTRAVRLEEQIAQGVSEDELVTDFEDLGSPRKLTNISRWYLFLNQKNDGGALFNASFTQPEIKPTSIPLDDISSLISDVIPRVVRYGANATTWSHYLAQRLNRFRKDDAPKPGCNRLGQVATFR